MSDQPLPMLIPIRTSQPFNRLTPAEAERLYWLSEECGEVVKAIGKILRHGYHSFNPDGNGSMDNRAELEREIGDIYAAVEMMQNARDIDGGAILSWWKLKLKKIGKYLHHQ